MDDPSREISKTALDTFSRKRRGAAWRLAQAFLPNTVPIGIEELGYAAKSGVAYTKG